MAFHGKFEQVSIINSASDDSEVVKALTIIHKDFLFFPTQACHAYSEKRIIEGLGARLPSKNNESLIVALSLSLLNSIGCYNLYRERIFQIKDIEDSLISLISPHKHGDGDSVNEHRMQIVHEEALKLLITLTAKSTKFQHSLASHGILPALKKLLAMYRSNDEHCYCCHQRTRFNEESREFSKALLEGKTLVGKVDLEQSSEAKKGRLNIIAVNLYDTTTDEDLNINQHLIDNGIAWPDNFPALLGPNDQKKCEVNWCEFTITKVVDAHCFWAHIDNEAEYRIKSIANILEDHVYSSDVCPVHEIEVGRNVFLPIRNEKCSVGWARGCVLETDGTIALVLLRDYGFIVKIDDEHLFPLPASVKDIPCQANLCVLKELQAPLERIDVILHTLELACNMTSSGQNFRMVLHQLGVSEDLLNLCKLGNKRIMMKSMLVLGNLALNFNIRAQLGAMDALNIILDLLQRHDGDEEAVATLLGTLNNLLVECSQNRKRISSANSNVLLVLLNIHCGTKTTDENRDLVLRVFKNLIADGWELIDPINIPDVRGIIDKKITCVKGSFNIPNMCGDVLLEQAKKERQCKLMKRGLRRHEALPDPTYASMTFDDLINKWKHSDSTTSDDEARRNNFTDSSDDEQIQLCKTLADYDGYIYRKKLNFREEEDRFCFMLEETVRKVQAIEIGNTICAFLNNGNGGIILVGVSKAGLTIGMNVGRRERDNLRLGVDDLMGRFIPMVSHDKYEIKFNPVMRGDSLLSLKQFEERFVISIHVAKNSSRTIYQTPAKKMLFRKAGNNCEFTVQELRERTIAEQEAKYQTQIKMLRLTLEEVKKKLKEDSHQS